MSDFVAESTVVRSLHGQRQSTTKWQRRRKGNWIRSQPDEHLIGTEQGIRRCRTIWRRPENKRWDRKLFDNFKGTPWQPRGGPTAVPGAPATPGLPAPGTPAGSNRGVYITLGLQLKHGQTPDCPGCYTPPSTIPVRTARCVGRDLKSWWPKNKEESGAAGGPAVPELAVLTAPPRQGINMPRLRVIFFHHKLLCNPNRKGLQFVLGGLWIRTLLL